MATIVAAALHPSSVKKGARLKLSDALNLKKMHMTKKFCDSENS